VAPTDVAARQDSVSLTWDTEQTAVLPLCHICLSLPFFLFPFYFFSPLRGENVSYWTGINVSPVRPRGVVCGRPYPPFSFFSPSFFSFSPPPPLPFFFPRGDGSEDEQYPKSKIYM